MKFWSCCQRKTSDFDNFLDQAGCEKGNHLWVKKQVWILIEKKEKTIETI